MTQNDDDIHNFKETKNETKPTDNSDILLGWLDIKIDQIILFTVTKTTWPTDTWGLIHRREHKQKLQKVKWIKLPWIFPTYIKQSFDLYDKVKKANKLTIFHMLGFVYFDKCLFRAKQSNAESVIRNGKV